MWYKKGANNLFKNRNRLIHIENKFIVTEGEQGWGIIRNVGLAETCYYVKINKQQGPTV